MNNKRIKLLFILVATFLLVGIVGFTMAYFSSSADIANEFNTGKYEVIATEVFESPDNWRPGETIPKTLTVSNTGDYPVYVRVCLNEKWTSYNGDDLPLEVNGERVAIINFSDNYYDYWSDYWRSDNEDNCLYHYDVLEPNHSTNPHTFIESVTFNDNIEADIVCTEISDTKKSCASTGDGYDKGKYILTFSVETVQANNIDKFYAWGAREGTEVTIGSEKFYVTYSDKDITRLIAKNNLLVGDVYDVNYDSANNEYSYSLNKTLTSSDPGYGLQNSSALGFMPFEDNETSKQFVGTVPFSGTNYWSYFFDYDVYEMLEEFNNHTYDYVSIYKSSLSSNAPQIVYDENGMGHAQNNGYTIAYYVENYINKLKELGAPSSIRGTLLSSYDFEISKASYIVSDHNKCETYFTELWSEWDLNWGSEYSRGNVVSFCNGGYDYYGDLLEYYIADDTISSNEYDTVGISDVVIDDVLYNSTYWVGDVRTSGNWFQNYYFRCYEDNCPYYLNNGNSTNYKFMYNYDLNYLFGVRPVIVIPTSELKENY